MVFVRDLDLSRRFYVDQLGFELIADQRLPSGDRWIEVAPPDGSANLALVAPKPDRPEYKLIGEEREASLPIGAIIAGNHAGCGQEESFKDVRVSAITGQSPRCRPLRAPVPPEKRSNGEIGNIATSLRRPYHLPGERLGKKFCLDGSATGNLWSRNY